MSTQTKTESSSRFSLRGLGRIGDAVVDLLFPPCCVACQRFGAWLCAECMGKIQAIHPPVCWRCGMPLEDPASPRPAPSDSVSFPSTVQLRGSRLLCSGCQSAVSQLNGLRAYAFHSGPLRLAIRRFKYDDLRCLAVPLGELMSQAWAELAPNEADIEAIVPVALHAARRRERGYNQAALLADELGAHLKCPVVADALIRTRATAPQVGLNAEERRANLHRAFECGSDSLAGRRVLLVDDVYTTGSTLEAACAALRDGGVLSVWAFTLSRACESLQDIKQNRDEESGRWN